MNTYSRSQTNLIRPTILLFFFLIGSFLWFYLPVITDMIDEWGRNPNNSHGFLIPFISAYFLWLKKDRIKQVEHKPANIGLFLIFTGIVIYVLGYLGAAHTTIRVSMFIFIAGVLIFLFGFRLFRAVSFPYFYSFFMIPVPYYLYEKIAFPLKLIVTKVSVYIIGLFGIPVIREGNVIMLENITLQVVDACSGIRSLTSLLAITVAYAYITQKTRARMFILVILSIPIAVFSNIVRVVVTGILSRYYGASAAEGFFHEFAGLGVFILSCLLIFTIGLLISKKDKYKI